MEKWRQEIILYVVGDMPSIRVVERFIKTVEFFYKSNGILIW